MPIRQQVDTQEPSIGCVFAGEGFFISENRVICWGLDDMIEEDVKRVG